MGSSFRFAILWAIVASIAVCQAQQPSVHLDRHARKVQKTLALYSSGSFLHITLRDRSDQFGELGKVTPNSFELLDTKTHTESTFAYADVRSIESGSAVQSAGWASQWPRRHWIPLAIVAVAAGVGGGILATR
jgi:hypothetical protein